MRFFFFRLSLRLCIEHRVRGVYKSLVSAPDVNGCAAVAAVSFILSVIYLVRFARCAQAALFSVILMDVSVCKLNWIEVPLYDELQSVANMAIMAMLFCEKWNAKKDTSTESIDKCINIKYDNDDGDDGISVVYNE